MIVAYSFCFKAPRSVLLGQPHSPVDTGQHLVSHSSQNVVSSVSMYDLFA